MFALLLPSFCNYRSTALVVLSQEPGLKKDDENNLLNNFIKPNKYVLTIKHETE